jgi:hypothetical protein
MRAMCVVRCVKMIFVMIANIEWSQEIHLIFVIVSQSTATTSMKLTNLKEIFAGIIIAILTTFVNPGGNNPTHKRDTYLSTCLSTDSKSGNAM